MNPSQDTLKRLEQSIKHLEITVTAARERLAEKFGEEHPTVLRLDSYVPSIQDQRKYINELQEAILNEKFDEVSRLVYIINSISYMIKEDAKDVLLEMQGISCKPDPDMLH